MLSASFWSLLKPAFDISVDVGICSWFIISLGFMIGVLFLILFDFLCKYISSSKNNYKRSWMVILSITLHNIPEGLIIGVAFGSVANRFGTYGIIEALLLTLSIAIQNFPEGCSISLPLKRDGYSNKKSFFIGQSSALVEPVSAVIGALLVTKIKLILPFLLAFAAGAMIFVVISELIPDMNDDGYVTKIIMIIGFILMMILDIGIK
jgi:ZIP family zinc transporter